MNRLITICLGLLIFLLATDGYSSDLFIKKNSAVNSYFAPSKMSLLATTYFNPLLKSNQDTTTVVTREQQLAMLPGYKLPKKALLFSALIPGAGELYVNSYLKAAAFFLVEAGAWTFYGLYTKKGNEQTDKF